VRVVWHRREVELGRAVGNRIIACDLLTLRAVLNWATMAGDDEGGMLLERNPLKGLPVPRNESPTRRVLTAVQYALLHNAAKTYRNARVSVFLTLAHETGHRGASLRQLHWSDIDLERGTVQWRAENDKIAYEHTTPLTDAALRVLERYRQKSRAIGDTWVFPSERGDRGALTKDGPPTSGSAWRRRPGYRSGSGMVGIPCAGSSLVSLSRRT